MKIPSALKDTLQSTVTAFAIAGIVLGGAPITMASSHSDAPLIKPDPQANLTDVYAFVGTKYNDANTKVLNVLVSVHPFCDPGDGVIYDRFADDALYSIHITDPVTGVSFREYDFQFSNASPTGSGLKNPNTILSYGRGTEVGAIMNVGDARQNFTQQYTVRRNNTTISKSLNTPPPNVGGNTTPFYNDADGKPVSGATTAAGLDRYTRQAINELPTGEVVFAGAATTASTRTRRASSICSTRGSSTTTGHWPTDSARTATAWTASRVSTSSAMRSRSRSATCRSAATRIHSSATRRAWASTRRSAGGPSPCARKTAMRSAPAVGCR